MIKGLTVAGLGAVDEVQLIRKAAEYGFGAVDIDAKALEDRLGTDGARELLEQHGVRIGAIGLPVEWRGPEREFRQGLERLAAAAAAAERLGCDACCTYILPSTDEKPAPFMAAAVRRLRICAEVLGAHGIRLGLEFVGPHHLRTAWKHPFIWTAEETLELIAAIGLPNVGLLVDTYHCYTTGLTAEELRKLRAEQIVHVHINDVHDWPVERLLDNDRLYPGEGAADLPAYLRSLKQIGYGGVVAQEVLTPEPPSGTLDELLERSRKGFAKVFAGV